MRRSAAQVVRPYAVLALASLLAAVQRETVRTWASAQDTPDTFLALGRSSERELAGGRAVSWTLSLSPGQFIRVVVDQRGVDVVVEIHGPGDDTLAEVDSPNDALGPESVVLVADTPGGYRLDVRSPQEDAPPGRIEVTLVESREATPRDHLLVTAQRALTEARMLRDGRTATSQRAALEKYEEAVSLLRQIGEQRSEAYALHAMALVAGDVGEYQQALDANARARTLYGTIGDERGRTSVLSNTGFVYRELGEYQKAIDVYEQARQAALATGDRSTDARFLSNIGANYASLGEYQTALDIHLRVLSMRRAANERRGQAITLNNIANCYEHLGDTQQARHYYGLAMELMPSLGNAFYTATTLNHLGVLYRGMGELQEALDHLGQALQLRRSIGDSNGEAATLYELARLERDRGNLAQARAHIENALASVEVLRGKLASQQLRASFFATARQYHEFHIDLLMRLHKQHPAEGFDARALQASEMARARSLLELLAEARADIRGDGDPELFERERALRQRIADAADGQMRLLSGRHTDEEAAAATRDIDALTDEHEQVEADIRRTSPRYAALTEPVPLTIEQVQATVLDTETLLLEYGLGDETSFLWAVTPTSMRSYELPGRAAIEAAARRLYDVATARSQSHTNETPGERQQRLERADAEYPDASAALSRILLAPVAEQLPGRRLLIVGEGVLQYMPFAALPVPGSDDGRPLVLDHEIVVLPSASVLPTLRREASDRVPPTRTLMVLADPVFSPNDPRVALPVAKRSPSALDASPPTARAERSAAERESADLVRLRFSRLEADEIERLADKTTSLVALDFAASRALATSAEMGRYRIVHFATHALIDNRHPGLTGVVLSLVDQQGRRQNGHLRIYDIYNLKLGADLVVLSACQTALGKDIRGEGLIGLTRGFMYAGASRVVASLWRIDDRATAELMKRFYQGLLGRGLRPAAALRAAQASMWQEKRWQAPYYWAPFTFQGEWR